MVKLFFIIMSFISLSIYSNTDLDSNVSKIYDVGNNKFEYKMPSHFSFISTLPENGLQFVKNSFSFDHDNLVGWGAIALSSALLIHFDQDVTNNVQRFGRKIGLGNAEGLKPTLKVGGWYLFRGPTNFASSLYFIGDGWITIGLTGAFMGTGYAIHDERAVTVGHELLQGLLLTGITTQIIKRSTGRESPNSKSTDGGVWRFFPKTSDFQGTISKYDAFPSGHLATTMTTFMILSENYPEYRWIKPVGYTLMSLLSFEMVNNSVHWAGDYPLALGIGYMIGKTIVENGRKKVGEDKNQHEVSFVPMITPNGEYGFNGTITF
jgi:hypothetical protein